MNIQFFGRRIFIHSYIYSKIIGKILLICGFRSFTKFKVKVARLAFLIVLVKHFEIFFHVFFNQYKYQYTSPCRRWSKPNGSFNSSWKNSSSRISSRTITGDRWKRMAARSAKIYRMNDFFQIFTHTMSGFELLSDQGVYYAPIKIKHYIDFALLLIVSP